MTGIRSAIAFVLITLPSAASAHVSVAGPAFAGERQVVTFSVGHGCEGADTVRVEVQIPEEVLSVRAVPGSFGEAELATDATGRVVAVTWEKGTARAGDDHYYVLPMRIDVPDAAFTTIYFPSTQTCRDSEGTETTVPWSALPGDGGDLDPAPSLLILPPRMPGWNKYTVPVAIADLTMFDDAQIVWHGEAAYSANPTTMELIRGEEGVTELTEIPEGATIWVKY